MQERIFLDSDVIISASLSKKGAAHEILSNKKLKLFISNYATSGLKSVTEKTGLSFNQVRNVLKNTKSINIKSSMKTLENNLKVFVSDTDDIHIVAAASLSKSKFLLTYKTKHYKIDKIKSDLNIIVTTPGNFLQYLRSKK